MSEIRIGIFIVPDASDPAATVEQIVAADRAGLELAGVQDHPYQRRFLDTWTLLSFAAARTERIRLVPDVINLQLRQPAVLAKSAASLDVLSGGRVEMGVGAGGFTEAIAAMGGPGLSGKESVDSMLEAVEIMRAFWSGERSISFEGDYHSVKGLHPGPPPAHRIGIWLGSYGPRMIRLTGEMADAWLPSLGDPYFDEEQIREHQPKIDEAARAAGRDPSEIERAVNVMRLEGGPDGYADELARLGTELRMTSLFVGVPDDDPIGFIHRLGEDVAPQVKEKMG